MLVKEIMTGRVQSIRPEESVAVAARALSRSHIGSLPVCSGDGRLRGMVTDRDIVLRTVAANEDPGQQTVREIMSRRLVTVAPEDPVAEAVRRMSEEQVRRLPVLSGERLVGLVTLRDLLRTPSLAPEAAAALRRITSDVQTLA